MVLTENAIFSLAEEFVQHTARLIFLTGKAGTGKTTFLRHIKERTTKNVAVVAPTGVAAIHAGGTTIHSFFQLPFSPFIPEARRDAVHSADLSDQYSLLKNLRVDREKRSLYRELELLIVDEVSMVRCDVLDAMDTILRHFRGKPYTPFGGVQVLFIGDLFQLPPVVPDDQWSILRNYYESPFFFHARALQHTRPLYLELKKIYRQSDHHFINLLNNVRNNEITAEDLEILNSRYRPDFVPPPEENYITLTTHNHKADAINAAKLEKLPGKPRQFGGEAEGDFPERLFPTDKVLSLKKGAQIMFIKNDMEKVRRYYNGKIGKIKRIDDDKIVVEFPGEINELEVEKDTWKNVRYVYNGELNQIEEEIIGSFTQYAIRLAWAVTIHKSQGLTFDKVIIDAGNSFAPGQVYVALSRCTSLEGIVLCSKIFRNNIMTDDRVLRFAEEEASPDELEPLLQQEREQYQLSKLLDVFDLGKAIEELDVFSRTLADRKFKEKEDAGILMKKLSASATTYQQVAIRFHAQLKQLADSSSIDQLQKRVDAAIAYFSNRLSEEFIDPLNEHVTALKKKPGVKGYLKDIEKLISVFEALKTDIQKAQDLATQLK